MKYAISFIFIFITLSSFNSCAGNTEKPHNKTYVQDQSILKIQRFDKDFHSYLANPTEEQYTILRTKYPNFLKAFGVVTVNLQDEELDNPVLFKQLMEPYFSNAALSKIYADALTLFSDLSTYELELTKANDLIKTYFRGKELPGLSIHVSGFKANTIVLDSIDSSYDEYIENFETIAEIVGKEDVAKAKIEEAEKVLSDVKDKAKDKVSDEEVLTVSPKNDEYTAHTSSSFVGQVLEKAGFKNAIQSDDREASLSLEQLVEINPDIIVYMRDDIDTTIYTQWKNTQLYKSLDAVKNNKVYTTVARGPWTQYRGFISVNTLTKEMSGWLLNN